MHTSNPEITTYEVFTANFSEIVQAEDIIPAIEQFKALHGDVKIVAVEDCTYMEDNGYNGLDECNRVSRPCAHDQEPVEAPDGFQVCPDCGTYGEDC